ncbi:MAG: beta-hexosaminidase, partial [Pseudomonadota bacterium]
AASSAKAIGSTATGIERSAACDLILHCNGDMTEMREIADAAPALSGEAARRAQAAERSIPVAVDPIAFAEEAAALDAALAAYA